MKSGRCLARSRPHSWPPPSRPSMPAMVVSTIICAMASASPRPSAKACARAIWKPDAPEHDPEKCEAVFRKDHAPTRASGRGFQLGIEVGDDVFERLNRLLNRGN